MDNLSLATINEQHAKHQRPATAGWRSTWGNATPRSGTYAFSFSTFAYGQLDADLTAAQPNTAYDLSASLRGSLANAQGCGGWVVRALFYDANYQYLGYTNAASGNQPGSSYAQVGSRTTPARTAWVKVSLLLYLSVGWVSFDDVSLKRVTLESSTHYYSAGGQRVARRVNGGNVQYLFGDHLGSAALVTDSSFTKVSEMRYNAWGKLRYTDGTAPAENAFTYTGQRQEADLGLMFYNARWYDSALGRFVQADPVTPLASQGVQAWDRYAYVNNSPVNFSDPSGNDRGIALTTDADVGYRDINVDVNLASSLKERNKPGAQFVGGETNLCGQVVASAIFETITGERNTLPGVITKLPQYKGTTQADIAWLMTRLLATWSDWRVSSHTRAAQYDCTILGCNSITLPNNWYEYSSSNSRLYERTQEILAKGHFIIASVMIDGNKGGLQTTGTLHWIAITGMDGSNGVWIYDPFINYHVRYAWSDFEASAAAGGYGYIEIGNSHYTHGYPNRLYPDEPIMGGKK